MSGALVATLEADKFLAMCRELGRLSGKDFEHVLRAQIAPLLEVCVRYTYAAKGKAIKEGVRFKNSRIEAEGRGVLSVNYRTDAGRAWLIDESTWENRMDGWHKKGKPDGKPPRRFGTKTAHHMNGDRRWGQARWNRYQQLASELARRQIKASQAAKSRGLAKGSWYQIAADAGVANQMRVPQFVKNTTTFIGKPAPDMGSSSSYGTGSRFVIELVNANRVLVNGPSPRFKGDRRKLDGHDIAARALKTRVSAFNRDVKNGVFDDIATRATRYPGIFVA